MVSGGALGCNRLDSRFRGNDGGELEKGSAGYVRRLISGGWVVRRLVDSRFRGSDRGRNGEGIYRSRFALGSRLRQNQDLRDYRIFRILPSRLPNAGFRGFRGDGEISGLAVRAGEFSANLKNSPKFGRKGLVLYVYT